MDDNEIIRIYEEILKGERKSFANGFWSDSFGRHRASILTKYMIEEKLKISIEEMPDKITARIFKKYGLGGMLILIFKGSPYLAIESAYPGVSEPWEFKHRYMWRGKKGLKLAKEATKYLIEEKLKIQFDEIPKITQKPFAQNGLSGMLVHTFNSSPYLAIENAYPGRFNPWEFTQHGMWVGEAGLKIGRMATRHLVEEKLKIPFERIPKITHKIFIDNGLKGMLNHAFNGSPYLAIENAYPGRFKKEDFINENTRKFKYSSKIGRKTQDIFVKYIKEYCKNKGIEFKYEQKAGTGRVEIWCHKNRTIVMDITRAITKQTITRKWRKRDYHKDPDIDEVWIVVNSDAFSYSDYLKFNKDSPDNVKVYHINEIFDKLGQPSREIKLKLEAYAMCRLDKKEKVKMLYKKAMEEGSDSIKFDGTEQMKIRDY